jgi:hypothetical protein
LGRVWSSFFSAFLLFRTPEFANEKFLEKLDITSGNLLASLGNIFLSSTDVCISVASLAGKELDRIIGSVCQWSLAFEMGGELLSN